MLEMPPSLTVEEIYRDSKLTDDAIDTILNQTLYPRPSTMLYDKMGQLRLSARHRLLDVGCRDARHTAVLVQRFGCHAMGIDPVDDHITHALTTIERNRLQNKLTVKKGKVEALPTLSRYFDYIWCRDVVSHLENLHAGLEECFRVLRAGGKMLIYSTFASNLLEPAEAVRLYLPLAVVAANMSHDYVEEIIRRVGFTITEKEIIGSEWRECWEEDGTRTTSTQLLHLARLRRGRVHYIQRFGRTFYEVELANCYWGIYQMLGKLVPTSYILEKPAK